MRFEPDFLQNQMLEEQPQTFDPYLGEMIDGQFTKTGVFYQGDGGVLLRLYAPEVHQITVQIVKKEYLFEKKDECWHELLLPFADDRNGPLTTDLRFDGTWLLYPGLPIYWSANATHNYVEFPHPDQAFSQLQNVPMVQ